MDLIKWMAGASQIPPLGFPKKFTVKFVHCCIAGCCCRPTASTCDITIKLPVHINTEQNMEDMITSAVKESYGFGLILWPNQLRPSRTISDIHDLPGQMTSNLPRRTRKHFFQR